MAPALRTTVDVVAMADHLCRRYAIGSGGSPPPEGNDGEALARLGVSALEADRIHSELMRRLEASRTFLDLLERR